MLLKKIKDSVDDELKEIDSIINNNLSSDVSLINDISHYITMRGGKRIRPLFTVLMSKACNYKGDKHLILSSIIELIHTATLLHDDVVDSSTKRRGDITINEKWGNSEAILVGDFLYTRAFQMMLNISDFKILKIIANATNTMAEGEAIQLLNRNNKNMTEKECIKIITFKTAQLFVASASGSAILGKCSSHIFNSVSKYGLHMGIAYQLVDDILDYTMNNDEQFGKNIADDYLKGIFTIPFVYAIQSVSKNDKKIIDNIILNKDKENFFKIRNIILKTGAIDYTKNILKNEVNKAKKELLKLPTSKYLNLILDLSTFIINRTY